jgi:hypothetical protein
MPDGRLIKNGAFLSICGQSFKPWFPSLQLQTIDLKNGFAAGLIYSGERKSIIVFLSPDQDADIAKLKIHEIVAEVNTYKYYEDEPPVENCINQLYSLDQLIRLQGFLVITARIGPDEYCFLYPCDYPPTAGQAAYQIGFCKLENLRRFERRQLQASSPRHEVFFSEFCLEDAMLCLVYKVDQPEQTIQLTPTRALRLSPDNAPIVVRIQ